MKKTILFVAAAIAAFSFSSCVYRLIVTDALPNNVEYSVPESGVPVREYHVGAFDKLSVGAIFRCTFVVSDSCGLNIGCEDAKLLENVSVNCTDRALSVMLNGVFSLSDLAPVNVTVFAPSLNDLSLSGSCTFECNDTLRSASTLELEFSGAVKADVRALKAKNVILDASGACEVSANVFADTLDVDGSGAFKANLLASGSKSTEVNLSGMSVVSVEFVNDCGDVSFAASGASSANFSGHVRSLSKETSGTVKVYTSDLVIDER